jgi:hypothetical protein
VVADLVRDDVGPGEVAGRAQLALHVVPEGEVEVDVAVARAVERADRGARAAARRVHRAVVEDDLRALVRAACALERPLPGRLGVVEDVRGEVLELRVGVLIGRDRLAARRALARVEARRDLEAGAASAEQGQREHEDHAQDAGAAADGQRHAAATAAAAAPAHVDDVACRCPSLPAH